MRTGMRRLAVLLFAGVLMAAVHPEAILKSTQSSVEAGRDLPLVGEEFSNGETFRLVLLGALNDYALGDVDTNDEGKFTIDLAIPANVRPGQYQLVAYAPDGDRSATMDVSVTAASPEAAEEGQGVKKGEGSVPPTAAGSGSAAIAAKLRRAIMEGAYVYRERLPSERELAEQRREELEKEAGL